MKVVKHQVRLTGSRLGEKLKKLELSRSVTLMEVCGTHTHALFRSGIRHLLPDRVKLLSGPGCPVCVTPPGYVDLALQLAGYQDTIIATFGDMIRVPGNRGSLRQAKAEGADIRLVCSPLDALALAEEYPLKRVVFLAVGFETTAPAVAATVLRTAKGGYTNLTFLTAHKVIPNVLRALLTGKEVALDGLLLPGHVATVTGAQALKFVPEDYGVPAAIAGFEPVQMLAALLELAPMAAESNPVLENLYGELVTARGNLQAQALMEQVFTTVDSTWRGIGTIPESGLVLKPELADYDTRLVYGLAENDSPGPTGCRCGEIITGKKIPPECSLFKTACTPERPVGPCMVSSEGTCGAYYKYNV
ncbi:MAG: hydrogenase formation protein HypD [Bacillota bacterium]